MSKTALVLVLRFGNGARVDIDLTEPDPKRAIAAFAQRALSNGAELPLVDAVHSELSVEKLREVLEKAPRHQLPAAKTPISVKGLVHAVGSYVKNSGGAKPDIPKARDALLAFFANHNILLDFADEPIHPGAER